MHLNSAVIIVTVAVAVVVIAIKSNRLGFLWF